MGIDLPPHIFRDLLASGRIQDMDKPGGLARWVRGILTEMRWENPLVRGSWGLSASQVQIDVTFRAEVKGRTEMCVMLLTLRSSTKPDLLAQREVEEQVREQLESFGAAPLLTPAPPKAP